MHVPTYETLPDPSVIMTLGRGYDVVDGQYAPTLETAARAKEAANYYNSGPAGDPLYFFSGWYGKVASRGKTPEPPAGVSEANMQLEVFDSTLDWFANQAVPDDDEPPMSNLDYSHRRTAIDDRSIDTFTNFTESVAAGHLEVGSFSPGKPLALSISRVHGWRASIAAQQALALPPNSLYRLRGSLIETGALITAKERLLLAVTRLALADVGETSGAEPGNLQHTKAASEAFAEMSRHPAPTILRAVRHPSLWRVPKVPLLRYWER